MLKFLAHLFLSPLFLTFAAGTSALGGGSPGGGTEGGGDAGGSEPVATWGEPRYEDKSGTDDGDGDGTGEADGADTGDTDIEEGFESFGDEDADTDAAAQAGAFPKDIFEKLHSEDPAAKKQAEKQVKRWFFENQRFRDVGFDSPEEARELVDKVAGWGGVEGIEKETQEAATFWTMLDSGDKGLMEVLEKEHGEGLTKLIPAAIDRYASLDPQGYAHKMAHVFMATLNDAPAGGISALAAFNQLSQIKEVKESPAFQRIAEVINGVADIAKTAPVKAAENPALTKREREVAEREQSMKTQALAGKATPVLSKHANTAGAVAFRGVKLTKDGKTEVLNRIHAEFAKIVAKDTDGKKARENLLAAGETEKWMKLVDSLAKRYMPQAARNAKRWYDGFTGASKKQASERRAEGESRREAGGGGASGGTVRTPPPNNAIVDWQRMRAEAQKHGFKDADDFFMSRRYLKKGDPKNTYSF